MTTEDKFDVVIFHRETMAVDAVVGENMSLDTGFYNARKRMANVRGRINDHYDVAIVGSGMFKEGSKLTELDIVE